MQFQQYRFRAKQFIPIVIGTLLCIQFQPGLLGQNFGAGLIVLSLLVVGWLLVTHKVSRIPFGFAATLICYPCYSLCISIAAGAAEVGFKVFVLSMAFTSLLIVMLSSYGVERMRMAFVWIMLGVAGALLLTTIVRYPSVVAQAPDLTVPIKHYNVDAIAFFPFALFWPNIESIVVIDLVNVPRAIGIFREPGLFQAFLCTSMLLLHHVIGRRYTLLGLSVLSLAVILTASTAGYVSLFVVAAILPFTYKVSNMLKMVLAVVAILIASSVFYLYFNDADGGLQNKLKTVSGRERIDAFNELEEQIGTARFLGLRSKRIGDLVVTQTGSLPSFILWEGIAGFILTLLPLAWIVLHTRSMQGITSVFPVLITALTSQPLWATGPFLTVMAFAIHERYFPDRVTRPDLIRS